MKKRNMAALALVAVMLLTACGRAADTAVTTEEIIAPEMSSKDILVNSLEYLLDDTGEETGKELTAENVEQAQTEKPETEDEDQEADEGDSQRKAVICYGKDMDSELAREEIAADEITPDVLLNALAQHNIVPLLDTKALSMEERDEDGEKILHLDLSKSFREYLMTMSMEAECIIISSIVNTFLSNYNADAVYITVEGETLVTSHTEYAEALSSNTPGEMMAYLTAVEDEAAEDGAEPKGE